MPLSHRTTPRALAAVSLVTALAGLTASCGTGPARPAGSTTATASSTPTVPSATSTTTTAAPPAPVAPRTTTPRAAAPRSCGQRLAAAMTPAQRAGQLLMVGLQPTGSSRALAAQVRRQGLGGVVYLGGWTGSHSVSTVSQRLQAAARTDLLVAADQEGGQVQQLRGSGYSRIPSPRVQAQASPASTSTAARGWSRQLRASGVNVDLAPVSDTVPSSLGSANAPIGRYQRDFVPGSPWANARYAAAFVRGARAGGVAATAKHFPGLGRVTGNTDTTASGTTDRTTHAGDAYLQPFRAAISAGVPLVMVSSATYPRIDPAQRAVFSRTVVTDLLRRRLGFHGVVVSDDVGAAAAVAGTPVGQRATRFIAAGGDLVLTARADQAGTMLRAIAAKRAASPAFARQVDAAAVRVLDLKAGLGVVRCG